MTSSIEVSSPGPASTAVGRVEFTLAAPVAAAIHRLAGAESSPVGAVLVAAGMALIGRCSGLRDVVLGWRATDRGQRAPIAVLRIAVDVTAPFRSLVRATGAALADASRSAAHGDGLVPAAVLSVGGADAGSPADLPANVERSVHIDEEMTRVVVTYRLDRLDEPSARLFGDRFTVLLADAVLEPDRAIRDLALLTSAETRAVLTDWNASTVASPAETIVARFDRQASATPEALAVTDESGTELSYSELRRRVDALAHRLREAGVRREQRCAVMVDRSANMAVAILAILAAGGAYVPVDLTTPDARVADMLTDAAVTIVLTEAGVSQLVPTGPWQVLHVDVTARNSSDGPDGAPALAISPSQLAYVMFTSGSTGRPKGVLIEHRCVTAFVDGVRALYPVDARDRYVQFSSLAFDVSTFDIFCALLTGASVHVASMATRRSLERIRLLLRDRAITLYMGTAGILKLLDPAEFPDLRLLAVGGEPVDRDVADRWAAGRQFLNSYGPTETTVAVVAYRFDGSDPGSPPIGRAMPNHRAYALDTRMRPVPIGVVGELFIGGPGTGRGYLDRPALTAAAFVPDPLGTEPGSRLYRTGDLVRWRPDGQLVFLGRVDGQVQIRGMRVEMGEITDVLLAQPQVAQAAVRAVPGNVSGVQLVAYVIPAAPGTFDETGLRDALAARLPSYMVPSEFVPLATMPLADTGKIDEAALVVAREFARAQPGVAAPATTATQRLLISDVLAPLLDTDAIAIDRNLFELGANSLHVLQILARVQDTFGVGVPFADFFEEPTAEGLAAAIDRAAFAELRASVRDAYDAMGPGFRRFRMTQTDALPAAIADKLLTAPAGRGLDLGVGDGSGLSAALAEVHQVTAVDICGGMLDAARLVHADLLDVELQAASFDWVLAQDVLSHLPPEQLPRALARIAEWLKPGGTALLTIADDDSPAVDEWFGVPVYRAGISAAGLRRLVQEAGLMVAGSAPCSWSTPAGPRPAWWLLASAHRTDGND